MSSIENKNDYESDDETQNSIIDTTFEEATTDPDYENIEEVDLGDDFVNENFPLYVHQKQLITKMVEAEQEGPIETEDGSFYSRLGAVALKPNSGKTAAAIGLCLAVPSLDKPDESMLGWSSSLVSMKLKSNDTRGYIETSVVICPNTLVNTWANNCDKFYGEGYYYIVKNTTEMNKEADKDGKVIGAENDITLKELTKKITSLKGKEKRGTIKSEEKELLPLLIEQKEHLKSGKKKASPKDKIEDLGTIDFLVEKMNSYPIIICPASSFAFLIPVFKEYEVTRLLLDELQKTTLTNQDYMKGYKTNPILEYLTNSRRGSTTSNRELSPARFIWLITATPHQLEKHEKGHFFNSWISKNAPFLKDYTNSINGNYMFPEMLCRYVIKFPDSYVSRFLNKIKAEKVTITVKVPKIITVLEGNMGDDFDFLLQNDNLDEIMRKLNIENTSVNDPDLEIKIISAAQKILKDENDEIRRVEKAYKNGGTSVQLKNNSIRIRENEIKIASIERKKNILNSVSILNSEEELTEDEEKVLECSICLEGPNERDSLMACPKCWGLCHDKCSLKWFKCQGSEKSCPKCKYKINSLSEMCIFNVNFDEKGTKTFKIEKTQESDYTSKVDAILDIVGENDDDFLRSNKGKVPERDPSTTDLDIGEIRKTLIYLNNAVESCEEIKLIQGLLEQGIAIFYDKTFSLDQAVEKYGPKARNLMKFVKDKKKIQKFMDEFEIVNRKSVFIMRRGSTSIGLNFPFVDAIVTYSTFSPDDMKQIIGRAEREGRVRKFFFINLEYD